MRELHLFAGAGGGILGGMLLGHTPVAAVEIEPYCQEVLKARQRDGILPEFPIYGDIREFDGKPWRGSVDVVCGGFPCQDISSAGKGAGITGERSGLWKEYARVIGEIRPKFVFAENSPLLRTRGLGVVLQDLAALGYDARWGVLGAWHVGAPHKRDRMWVLAHPGSTRARSQRSASGNKVRGACGEHVSALRQANRQDGPNRINPTGHSESQLANTDSSGSNENTSNSKLRTSWFKQSPKDSRLSDKGKDEERPERFGWWHTDPAEVEDASVKGLEGTLRSSLQGGSERPAITDPASGSAKSFVGRVAHGLAHRVDRLKAIGNGQVPQCAAMAFRILSQGLI